MRDVARRAKALLIVAASTAMGFCPTARGSDANDKPVEKSLIVSAKAAAAPAFKHRLYPLDIDRRPGNAAPMYTRIGLSRPEESARKFAETAEAWTKLAIEQLPKREIHDFLNSRSYDLRQLHLGARRQECQWNYALDDKRILWILLPDVQMLRPWGRVIAAKARLEIAEGRFESAAETLTTGFAFASHVAEGPFLINGLVGIAMATELTDAVFDFASQPDSPNLYWPLTALPQPLINLRRQFETEQRILEMEMPEFADIGRHRPAETWDELWMQLHVWINELAAASQPTDKAKWPNLKEMHARLVAEELPAAKKYLASSGRMKPAEIDALSPKHAIVLAFHSRFCEIRDDIFKACYLPYPAAARFYRQHEEMLQEKGNDLAICAARQFGSAIGTAHRAAIRLDRRIALLRTVEAIRMHAAKSGSLPKQLQEIEEVPAPNDPFTDRPFEYRVESNVAVIEAPVPEAPSAGMMVRIQLRK